MRGLKQVMQEKEGVFQRLIREGKTQEAIDLAKSWERELSKSYRPSNATEYGFANSDSRYAMRGYFDWRTQEGVQRSGGRGSSAGLSSKIMKDKNWREVLISAVTKGGYHDEFGNWKADVVEDAISYYLEYNKQNFYAGHGLDEYGRDANGVVDELRKEEWDSKVALEMKSFFDEMESVIKDHNGNLWNIYEKFLEEDTYINSRSDFYHSDFVADRGQRAINFFKTLFFKNDISNTAEIVRQMEEFTSREFARYISTPPTNNPGQEALSRKALDDRIMSARGDDLIWKEVVIEGQGGRRSVGFRNDDLERVLNNHAESDRENFARILGIDIRDVEISWMSSDVIGGRNNDILGKAVLTVRNGTHAGSYYHTYDNSGNSVIKRLDGTVYEGGNSIARRREQTIREQSATTQRDRETLGQMFRQGTHPISGEAVTVSGGAINSYISEVEATLRNPPETRNTSLVIEYSNNWNRYTLEEKIEAHRNSRGGR